MTKATFKVNGMSCAHCEGRVNTALEALEGVKQSKASAKKAEVTVKYEESSVTLDAIKEAVRQVGYEVAQ